MTISFISESRNYKLNFDTFDAKSSKEEEAGNDDSTAVHDEEVECPGGNLKEEENE